MGPGAEPKSESLLERTRPKKLGFRTKFNDSFEMDVRFKKRKSGTRLSPSKTIGGYRGLAGKSENTPYLGFRIRF